jgi:small redox-active disulfide protein 2
MKLLQVLGTGCPKCSKLAQDVETAAKELGIEYNLEKITDINVIMGLGVMMTPALFVDGVQKVAGRCPNVKEIKEMIK